MKDIKEWRALDYCDTNNKNEAEILHVGHQYTNVKQRSFEEIIIRNSEGVDVNTTDRQVAVSLQLGIQAAIGAVIIAAIGDSDQQKAVVQDIKQFTKSKQLNYQRTVIEGSRKVAVTTIDTDVAVNIQALLQVLVAIVAKLDIL